MLPETIHKALIENYRDYARVVALHFWRAPFEREESIAIGNLALVCAVANADGDRLSTLPGLIWRFIRDAIIKAQRKEFRRLKHTAYVELPERPEKEAIPIEILHAGRQAHERMSLALPMLPEGDRQVLHALFIEERSTREAARVCCISQTRVVQRRDRALDQLRRRIAEAA